MGQRISEWEAAAQRTADGAKARVAASASEAVRAGMQEEIEASKKQRRRAMREREYARQMDRQREGIHPAHVLDALAAMQPASPPSLRLPPATPDPDKEYPVWVLSIRPYETENNS
jgi:hypothetical protein